MNAAAAMLVLAVIAANPSDFREANEAFLNGKYDQAIELYTGILKSGFDCPDVHYNLGNAYLASGRIGMAVLQYERALKADPYDADAAANLELAKKPLLAEPAFTPSLRTPVEDFFRKIPQAPVSFAALIAWSLTFGLLLIRRFSSSEKARRALGYVLAASASCAIVMCIIFSGVVWVHEYRPRCVVLTDSAELKEGPSVSFKSVIGLKEGLTLGIRGSEAGWYKVVLPSGVTGWVKTETVEKI